MVEFNRVQQPVVSSKTPKELNLNNPGPDGYRDNPGMGKAIDNKAHSHPLKKERILHEPQNEKLIKK